MAYTITDLAELVEYHLVVSAPDDDAAHSNLVQLVSELERMAPRSLWREATWVFATAAGARSTPTSFTRRRITTATMATSLRRLLGHRGCSGRVVVAEDPSIRLVHCCEVAFFRRFLRSDTPVMCGVHLADRLL